jgi:hypothetical protein
MLRILGSPKQLCDGITRRDMLWASGLGLLGLGAPTGRAAGGDEKVLARSFGRAKSCILLFLYGSPSQLETFDMKPEAPVEIRGEMKPIRSSLPGLDVCEHLPNAARVMDRVTVVRSMTHPYPIHGVAYATTGVPMIDVPMELNPHDTRHWPFIGSVVDWVGRNKRGSGPLGGHVAPSNIGLPWHFSSKRIGEVPRAGPYAAFLGGAYNPVWTEFHGSATRTMLKTLQDQKYEGPEPYLGITRESRFSFTSGPNPADTGAEITLDRLDRRCSLLQQLDQARPAADDSDAGRELDQYRRQAHDMLGSPRVRAALDLEREPIKLRESYGLTVFGQAALTARRLVEAGSRFVTVFWDEYGLAGSGWDTHWDHFARMKNELMPGFDRALFGLIEDLDQRGLLDETLVLVLSEHGRTPKLSSTKGGGRDHWSQAYSVVLAGGGVARGKVVGRSDRIAGTVQDRPVSPKDILATAYHLLGIDLETKLTDRIGRPVPLLAEGKVVPELLDA